MLLVVQPCEAILPKYCTWYISVILLFLPKKENAKAIKKQIIMSTKKHEVSEHFPTYATLFKLKEMEEEFLSFNIFEATSITRRNSQANVNPAGVFL